MSVYVSAEVWAKCEQVGHRLLCMLALADYCNDEGNCWPSQEALAQRCRCTERGAQKMIDGLIKDKEIEVTHKGGKGRGDRTEYFLSKYVREKGERRSEKGRTRKQKKGERGRTPILEEPSVEPPLEPSTMGDDLFASEKFQLPPPLNTPEIEAAWIDWEKVRRENKKALTPTTRRMQIRELVAMGATRALAALKHSASNGYTGLYEPGNKQTPPPQKRELTRDSALR